MDQVTRLSSYAFVVQFGLLAVLVASGAPWGKPFPIERRVATVGGLVVLWAASMARWRRPREDGS